MSTTTRRLLGAIAAVLVAASIGAWTEIPAIGAGALLHPSRHVSAHPTPPGCADAVFDGAGVTLRGWRCATSGLRRGTIVYLHGVADNRGSAARSPGFFPLATT